MGEKSRLKSFDMEQDPKSRKEQLQEQIKGFLERHIRWPRGTSVEVIAPLFEQAKERPLPEVISNQVRLEGKYLADQLTQVLDQDDLESERWKQQYEALRSFEKAATFLYLASLGRESFEFIEEKIDEVFYLFPAAFTTAEIRETLKYWSRLLDEDPAGKRVWDYLLEKGRDEPAAIQFGFAKARNRYWELYNKLVAAGTRPY